MEPNTRLVSRETSQKLGTHTQGVGAEPQAGSPALTRGPCTAEAPGAGLGAQNSGSWPTGSVPSAVESSRTRDRACVPCFWQVGS